MDGRSGPRVGASRDVVTRPRAQSPRVRDVRPRSDICSRYLRLSLFQPSAASLRSAVEAEAECEGRTAGALNSTTASRPAPAPAPDHPLAACPRRRPTSPPTSRPFPPVQRPVLARVYVIARIARANRTTVSHESQGEEAEIAGKGGMEWERGDPTPTRPTHTRV